MIERLLEQMITRQQARLLELARRIEPAITPEDLLQPHNHPKISANPDFNFEDGMSTFSSFALLPLRMRVSISAIGSVIIGSNPSRLPTGLYYARDLSPERSVPETNAAHVEFSQLSP